MEKPLLLFMILSFAFAKAVTAQTNATIEDVAGVYKDRYSLDSSPNISQNGHKFFWKLTLSLDGRFEYHYFSQLKGQEEEHFRGRGNWEIEKRTITFSTNDGDVNEEYFLDFNESKARFFKTSVRNKKTQDKLVYLHFFISEAKAIENLKLFKAK